ncbi:polysaccharide deacetylase family protein [Chakrabartyella piscis]|uniref:polysaccharide deacetylase family protein n=1 Tax=Chakrabartyella piscis TaxID=2918914 RepID=UPI00295887EC|nr:polysaccharide deacetylase family protein [Chakrabartyella piscis]
MISFLHKQKKTLLICASILCGVCLVFSAPPTTALVSSMVSATQTRQLPIYCVDTPKKQISISFDAAWGADDTDELLRILEENNVKTTFFLCGYWVEDYPEEVQKIADAGHDLGNHSATHPHMNQLSAEQIAAELASCHASVKEITGIDMDLFRPPFGEYNDTVISTVYAEGYYPIQWDVDSLDWKEYGVESEINQVLNHEHLGNGSIILFHNDAQYTPAALDTIIKGLQADGYEIVPLSELIHRDDFKMDHEGRQILNS